MKHGTASGYTYHKCRCDECRRCWRETQAQYVRRKAYGIQNLIDAEPAREHVLKLREAGYSIRQISEISGISDSALQRLIGLGAGGMAKRTKRIRSENSEALLALRPEDYLPGTGTYTPVDVRGTRRRIKALVAVGYSRQSLAEYTGLTRTTIDKLLGSFTSTCGAETRNKVVRVYSMLDHAGPLPHSAEEWKAYDHAIEYGRKNRLVPPHEWYDIDNPLEKPTK